MTIALGHYALWLAGALALIQAVIPALLADERRACAIAVSAAKTQAALFTLSIAALAYGFLANDFSVRYIAAHSNSLLPWYYRATAVWGGHEGSLLLWITILAWWAAAFAAKSRNLPDAVRGKTLAILGYISVGFTGFIGFTSNPFTRILPAPFDGADLNPLLQDPGLILHPSAIHAPHHLA
ncbi:cytochrome c biogenesis protein CcsA [uncultured Cardiobacterium sp.]|uniref:cytochrome c biogenesis protein CcsA n=1 Tax=uncultured Cardiobacterium sp. TaxID=417619 RepID=UPI0026228EBD|nr:cytochrome c biogenesis protein CcsA [uncultured Cardiobacterium sp.]